MNNVDFQVYGIYIRCARMSRCVESFSICVTACRRCRRGVKGKYISDERRELFIQVCYLNEESKGVCQERSEA